MEPARRIIINTTAQYSRSVINTIISLYTTRLILAAMGLSDYGIYAIVGGIVAMLGFITNALVVTTQRYISFQYGKNDLHEVRKVFVNSIFIHVVFALALCAVLIIFKDMAVYKWINIPPDRLDAAGFVYIMTTVTLGVTILTAPYKAVFIAHENIVYISIIEVCDGFMKLILAIIIVNSDSDRLMMYAAAITIIQLCNLLAFAIYATRRFKECKLCMRKAEFDTACIRNLIGFAGWTTYGTGAIVFRNQGIAIMLNNFFGTITNAAYGIAFQVYGAMAFVSTSILNAMNPQIIKAEGASNRQAMLYLALQESKFSSALMMMITFPVIMEIHPILDFWLEDVPEEAGMFCTFILMSFIFDQLTYGLNTANQAYGHIKTYTLLLYTPKMVILFLIWLVLSAGCRPVAAMWIYLLTEILMAFIRIPYMKYTAGLSTTMFIRNVIIPLAPLAFTLWLTGRCCTILPTMQFRFVITFIASVVLGMIVFWQFTINAHERSIARNFIARLYNKKAERNKMHD